jgi:hypothetical protein
MLVAVVNPFTTLGPLVGGMLRGPLVFLLGLVLGAALGFVYARKEVNPYG